MRYDTWVAKVFHAPPSLQHADGLFEFYLKARLPGDDHEEYRKFLRGAWASPAPERMLTARVAPRP